MNFTERLQCFPPILCRLLARVDGRPKTFDQIAHDSGAMPDIINMLSPGEIASISRLTNWKGFSVHQALALQRGTVGTFDNTQAMRRLDNYLRHRPTFAYLRRSPEWETYYKPLLIHWRNCYPYNITPTDMPHPHLRQVLNRLTPLHQRHQI